MRKILKLFCLFLTIVIVFNGFNAIAFAEQNVKSNNVVGDSENILLKGDLPLSELKNRQLPNQDKPETVSTKSIDANGHVNRLREQEESLNDIMFQNRDGTKTLYSFSYPVKYVAKDGTIRDKKTNISTTIDKSELKNDYEYANVENDIKTYFPKKLSSSNGVLLEVADVEIEMFPVSSQKATAEKNNVSQKANQSASLKSIYKNEDGEEKDTVIYKDVFGKDTSLRYTPQFVGFKEDIILDKYTGVNEFVFIIKTNGLSLINSGDGSLILVDPDSNIMVASLGNLMIYDSSVDGNGSDKYTRAALYEHYYRVATEKENSEYLVTIHVDDAYLKSDATVYPVYVDPTLTVWHTIVLGDSNTSSFGNYSNYMQTTYIQQGDATKHGTALMKVGAGATISDGNDEEERMPDSRGLIDFDWLTYSDSKNPLVGKNVTSAYLYVRDLFPSISETIVGLYGVNQSWSVEDANGALWNKYTTQQYGESKRLGWQRGVAAIGDTSGQSVGHWYYFNVADYVKDVLKNKNSYGLMLKVSDSVYENKLAHTIAGATYLGDPSLRPALVVTYDGIYTQNANVLNFNSTENIFTTLSINQETNCLFYFNATADVEYYIKSVGQWTANTVIRVYNSSGDLYYAEGVFPNIAFIPENDSTYYIQIFGINLYRDSSATVGKFIFTRDYRGTTNGIPGGCLAAYYDESFSTRRYSVTMTPQDAINRYFTHITSNMKRYFNIDLTIDTESYSDITSFSTNNGTDTYDVFYTEAEDLANKDAGRYTFAFTGTPLSKTDQSTITHDPAEVDCTYVDLALILITRQNNYYSYSNERISASALHELLHNFGTRDHYCGVIIGTGCTNEYCWQHTTKQEYKFNNNSLLQFSCVMYSPINDGHNGNLCGLCMRDVMEGLDSEN